MHGARLVSTPATKRIGIAVRGFAREGRRASGNGIQRRDGTVTVDRSGFSIVRSMTSSRRRSATTQASTNTMVTTMSAQRRRKVRRIERPMCDRRRRRRIGCARVLILWCNAEFVPALRMVIERLTIWSRGSSNDPESTRTGYPYVWILDVSLWCSALRTLRHPRARHHRSRAGESACPARRPG